MKHAHGFTLLELAIVLMVLALLVGGILKWQELGESQALISTPSKEIGQAPVSAGS